MNFLQTITTSQCSVASPDGQLVASIYHDRLTIQSTRTDDILRSWALLPDAASKCQSLRWFRSKAAASEESQKHDIDVQRILLATEQTVYVYDVQEPSVTVTINGACGNLGRTAGVDFGYSPNEILVSSDFAVKLTIWSTITSRGVEIKDPKMSTRGYSYRTQTGHLAILTRPTAHDVLMLLTPTTYTLLESIEIPTVDAQGIKWSPDGRWLAIWDISSGGYKVLIYTADGHLFRTYLGGQDANTVGLGVKSVEWSLSSGVLAIGDYNDCVTLLGRSTLSPIALLRHTTPIKSPRGIIWQEQMAASTERSYITATQPACPPPQAQISSKKPLRTGISTMIFNNDSTLLASKCDSHPTTVWIWSLASPTTTTAVLIHHSPIKKIQWHATHPHLLVVHCATPTPSIHLWSSTWSVPRIHSIPISNPNTKSEASFLHTSYSGKPLLLYAAAQESIISEILNEGEEPSSVQHNQGQQEVSPGSFEGLGPDDMFDEGSSIDLSPIKRPHDGVPIGKDGEEVEDTFHYRKYLNLGT